jgi:hypothetical protein
MEGTLRGGFCGELAKLMCLDSREVDRKRRGSMERK